MNTIGRKFISGTLALTTGAWILGASFFVPVASAQTSASLQAQIAALLAQVSALQAQLNSSSGSSSSVSFTRNLTVGSTGNDVKSLQIFLNSKGFVVAASGAGSPGNESTYFGAKTKAALAKYQAANGISPASGFFGPITRSQVSGAGGGIVNPGGNVPPGNASVTLSADNPAAGTVTTGASHVPLARFTFSGSYTVTGVVLKRIGVSADASLSNVFLYDRDSQTRLTDAASVSSGSLINFTNPSGLFTVNGTRNISVRVDLAANSGETIGVQLVSYTVSGGSPITANLSGNLFSVASASLASVSISNAVGSGNSDPGNGVLIWQGTLNVSTRNVVFSRLALRQIGSVNNGTDIRNFNLFVDGVQVGSAVASPDANGYVTFSNLNTTLITGARILKVVADVIGGSSRTVQLSLRGAYDLNVQDIQYNLNPAVTATPSFPFGPAAFTVNSGVLVVAKAASSPATNVTINGSNVDLADYTFTAFGEPIKVQTITVGAAIAGNGGATSTLRNGVVMINGTQYGSTADINNIGRSYTTNFVVNPGSPANVQIRADVFDNTSGSAFNSTSTVQIVLRLGATNGIGQISLNSLNVPTADQVANTVTAASGALTITRTTNYGNQTTVVPQTAYKLADFSLANGNVEPVNVNTLTLTYNNFGGNFSTTNMQNVYIKYGSSMTSVKPTPTASGDSFSVTFTIAQNSTMPIQVFADLKTGISASATSSVSLAITATTASGVSAPVAATPGQLITANTGSYTVALDASTPVSQIVDDTGNVTSVVAKILPVNDTLNLTGLTVLITDPSAVQNFDLLYNGTAIRSAIPAATTTAITGLTGVSVPANSSNNLLAVRLNMNSGVGVGAGATGGNLTTNLTNFTGTSASTGSSASITGSASGTAVYVYHAIPIITRGTNGVATLLGAGTKTVADFTIAPTGGNIGWEQMVFTVATSTASTTYASNGAGSTLLDVTTGNFVPLLAASSTAGGTFTITPTTELALSSPHEYQLNVVISVVNGLSTGNSMTFQIARPTGSFAASNGFTTLTTSTASFVWTDQSAATHSNTTADWSTDFLVKNLPTNTWTLGN